MIKKDKKTKPLTDSEGMYTIEHLVLFEIIDKDFGCSHGANGVRRGRAHTNREQIKGGNHGVMLFLLFCDGFLVLSLCTIIHEPFGGGRIEPRSGGKRPAHRPHRSRGHQKRPRLNGEAASSGSKSSSQSRSVHASNLLRSGEKEKG